MNTREHEPVSRTVTRWKEADWAALLTRLERVYRSLGLTPELARAATRADAHSLTLEVEAVPAAA